MTLRIALVTCATLPDLDPDDQRLIEPLRARGADPVPAVWDDTSVDWDAFDLAVIRNTWDYPARRDEFVAWARSVPRLANPAPVIEWNTDKHYLTDLAAAGLPVVPTVWLADATETLPETGTHVLKPAVGAGSVDAARFSLGDRHEAALARRHARRLLDAGQTVMVQPYVEAIETRGETGVIFVGGQFSHAIGKGAMLSSQRQAEAGGLYLEETIVARDPTADELSLAQRAIEAAPAGPDGLVYARIDLVPGANANPLIMELELTEPSLFMKTTPGSEELFADAIVAAAERARRSGR
ncbi:MAG TPA: hypothetical protein VEX62_08700 [Candidatus Limnocylindrales bacterium]|nr:hypothetical protein [Candidatus Limnocylindrales bacterium]